MKGFTLVEKPFKCHNCDKKFDQKDKLREHAKIHKDTSDLKKQVGYGWTGS